MPIAASFSTNRGGTPQEGVGATPSRSDGPELARNSLCGHRPHLLGKLRFAVFHAAAAFESKTQLPPDAPSRTKTACQAQCRKALFAQLA